VINLLNPTDIVFAIFIIIMAIKGAFKGLISEAFGLTGLALGILFADQFNAELGSFMVQHMATSRITANILAFIFIFFVIYVLIFLLGVLITSAIKKVDLGFMNRTFGFIFGAAKAYVVIVVIALIFSTVSFLKPFSKNMQHSSQIYAFTSKIIKSSNLVQKIDEIIKKR
jgi:membrane protein required for colicin V production